MQTTVYLIRNGVTDWNRDGRLAGRRELGLSLEGRAQADDLALRLASVELNEVLASPLPRAGETAERVASKHRLEVARDPRLTDVHIGKLEGLRYTELEGHEGYRRFLAGSDAAPGGERLGEVRDRMIASVSQALADNELGASIAIISHAAPLRVLLTHYLGMEVHHFARLRVSPTSVSVIRFDSELAMPRLLALNCLGDVRQSTT